MTVLFNIAKMSVSGTPGTGNITLGSAVTGWLDFATSGATNGVVVSYNAVDGTTQEDGTATYSTTGPSLTGRTLTNSTSGSLLSLTSNAVITLTARSQDIVNKTGDTLTGSLNFNTEQTVASATTTDIGAATSNAVLISGTTTITGLGTIASGAVRFVRFSGILTLTYNATSLILPGLASITTAAGDCATFVSMGSGNWRCEDYQKADGTAVVAPSSGPVLLATLSGTGVASLSDTTHLTSAYQTYWLICRNLTPVTTGGIARFTYSINAGSSYLSSNYSGLFNPTTYLPVSSPSNPSPATFSVGEFLSGMYTFINPSTPLSNGACMFGTGFGRGNDDYKPLGSNSTSSYINGIKFDFTAGTFSGVIELWGVP